MFRDAISFRALAGAALLALAAGCTVQPLYGARTVADGDAKGAATALSMQGILSNIAIKPVDTRHAQMVRNRLIFLFGQGAGEPDAPVHTMALSVSRSAEGVAAVQLPGFVDTNQPSAQRITLTGSYSVSDEAGQVVASGSRSATANYDVPNQGFAERSAAKDAEDRAARELAEMIHLAVAQAFAAR